MAGAVTRLRVVNPREPARNGELVRTLRRLCLKAERGEISSAAFVTVGHGGNVSTGWDSCGTDSHNLISGASMLHHRLVAGILGDDE